MSQETIAKVFSRDKFSIPKYQRDYAWSRDNFKDLWEDLNEALELSESSQTKGHFLGTMVVSPNNEDSTKYDIIDGQQRSTTIFMLLYALIDKSEFKQNYRIKYLFDIRNDLKLEVSPQNREFFKELLESSKTNADNMSKKADSKGKQNLAEVYGAILDKVANLDSNKIEKYIQTLNNMIIMWLEEPNAGRAIRTFQSVNDRGVPLNLLDKLKSLLIYYSNTYCNGAENELDSIINETFGDIFRIFLQIDSHKYISNIGNQQFSESDIFRYHLGSIKFNGMDFLGHYRNSNKDSYEKLKVELKKLQKDKLENFIRFYIHDLKRFFTAFLDLLNEIESNAYIFKAFMLEKINPYFYNTLVRLKIKDKLDNEIITLISKADILFFKNNSSCDATAYNLIHSCLEGNEKLKEKIISECKRLRNVRKFIDNFVSNAYNSMSFHYIFFEQNCGDMNADSLKNLVINKKITQEKEHIIPYFLYENEDNKKLKTLGFAKGWKEFESCIDSYGNLLSLENALNSKASNKDLLSKAEVYEDSKIPFVRRFDVANFNKEKLIERNKDIESFLQNEFFSEFLS